MNRVAKQRGSSILQIDLLQMLLLFIFSKLFHSDYLSLFIMSSSSTRQRTDQDPWWNQFFKSNQQSSKTLWYVEDFFLLIHLYFMVNRPILNKKVKTSYLHNPHKGYSNIFLHFTHWSPFFLYHVIIRVLFYMKIW